MLTLWLCTDYLRIREIILNSSLLLQFRYRDCWTSLFIFSRLKRLRLSFRLNSDSINELNPEEYAFALLMKPNSQSLENFSHNIYSRQLMWYIIYFKKNTLGDTFWLKGTMQWQSSFFFVQNLQIISLNESAPRTCLLLTTVTATVLFIFKPWDYLHYFQMVWSF